MTDECIPGRKLNKRGYARVCVGHATWALAHRVVWEREHGEIPEGMHLHHVCENKACVNIEHLELVSPREHGERHWRCDHDERYISSQGWSRCRACDRRRQAKHEAKKKVAA